MTRTILTLLAATLLVSPAYAAEHDHAMGHGSHDMKDVSAHEGMDHAGHDSMDMGKDAFLVKKAIDGYTVSFHVMAAAGEMNHGGSHDFMVKIEKGETVVTGLAVNSKVIGPDGAESSKPMAAMGEWLMAGYDLGTEGRYQLMVLFRSADGAKHFGGVWYPQ